MGLFWSFCSPNLTCLPQVVAASYPGPSISPSAVAQCLLSLYRLYMQVWHLAVLRAITLQMLSYTYTEPSHLDVRSAGPSYAVNAHSGQATISQEQLQPTEKLYMHSMILHAKPTHHVSPCICRNPSCSKCDGTWQFVTAAPALSAPCAWRPGDPSA